MIKVIARNHDEGMQLQRILKYALPDDAQATKIIVAKSVDSMLPLANTLSRQDSVVVAMEINPDLDESMLEMQMLNRRPNVHFVEIDDLAELIRATEHGNADAFRQLPVIRQLIAPMLATAMPA